MSRLGMADLHIHTSASDGMMTVPELLNFVEKETLLDVIAITDHDEINGALEAQEIVRKGKYRFEVINGIEISTLEGHLLALFVDEAIPSNKHVDETIEYVHKIGGICIASHPLSWLTRSLGETTLDRVACQNDSLHLDALETGNGQIAARVTTEKIKRLNKNRYHLPETGGSDAHFLASVGSAYTTFPGCTTEDVRRSIAERTCRSELGSPVSLKAIGHWQVARQLTRGLVTLPARNLCRSFMKLARKGGPA